MSHKSIDLRVDGVEYPEVTRRFAIEDGYPGGKPEIVVRDPNLGEFTLTEECKIEIRDTLLGGPKAKWLPFTLADFTFMVERAIEVEGLEEAA